MTTLLLAASVAFVGFVGWGIWAIFTTSRGRFNSGWAIILGFCLSLGALGVIRPHVPRWLFTVLVGGLGISCEKLVRRNRASVPEETLGQLGTVVRGHPDRLAVEVADGVWEASTPPGLVVLAGEQVIIIGSRGRELLVGRP